VLGIFAWAGLKLQSSWSLPPESLGLHTWATCTWPIGDLHLFIFKANTDREGLALPHCYFLCDL
jgi:hypothetical protein